MIRIAIASEQFVDDLEMGHQLGISASVVHNLCVRGILEAMLVGRTYRFPLEKNLARMRAINKWEKRRTVISPRPSVTPEARAILEPVALVAPPKLTFRNSKTGPIAWRDVGKQ